MLTVSPALWGCETRREQEQTGSQGDVFAPSQRVEAGWTSPQGTLNLHPAPLLASPGVRDLLALGHHLCVLFAHTRTDGLLAVRTEWS